MGGRNYTFLQRVLDLSRFTVINLRDNHFIVEKMAASKYVPQLYPRHLKDKEHIPFSCYYYHPKPLQIPLKKISSWLSFQNENFCKGSNVAKKKLPNII